MRITRRQKLELIDNYISIYRVLYSCKFLLETAHSNTPSNTELIYKLCDQILDLKSKYEYAFESLNMVDNSFLLLKQQLTSCKPSHQYKNNYNINEIYNDLNNIENAYSKLNL